MYDRPAPNAREKYHNKSMIFAEQVPIRSIASASREFFYVLLFVVCNYVVVVHTDATFERFVPQKRSFLCRVSTAIQSCLCRGLQRKPQYAALPREEAQYRGGSLI